MVTYLANASYGRNDFRINEGLQLEAYCSGVGKVLLAHLPDAARENYLSQGEFIALTPNTIVDREAFARELDLIRQRGWGTLYLSRHSRPPERPRACLHPRPGG